MCTAINRRQLGAAVLESQELDAVTGAGFVRLAFHGADDLFIAFAEQLQADVRMLRPQAHHGVEHQRRTFARGDVADKQHRGRLTIQLRRVTGAEHLTINPAVDDMDRIARHAVVTGGEVGDVRARRHEGVRVADRLAFHERDDAMVIAARCGPADSLREHRQQPVCLDDDRHPIPGGAVKLIRESLGAIFGKARRAEPRDSSPPASDRSGPTTSRASSAADRR